VTAVVPTGHPVARGREERRLLPTAVAGGAAAFAALVGASELLAAVLALVVRAYGVWTWVKTGLLAAMLSLRAEVVASVEGRPLVAEPTQTATYHWRLVPMVLTLVFVVLAARAGGRAVAVRPNGSSLAAVALSAAGVGIPVAILAFLAASLAELSVPSIGATFRVDPTSAAIWGGLTASAAAAAGAVLDRGSVPLRSALRGGVTAYAWALIAVTAGWVVVATLEPTITRAYVGGLLGIGTGGAMLLGAHVLSLPALAALTLAPAAGTCVGIAGTAGSLELCPWSLSPVGPGGLLVSEPLSLSPLLWIFAIVPPLCAVVAGRRAALEWEGGLPVRAGIGGAVVFAATAVAGAWYAGARLPVVVIPEVVVRADLVTMGAALTGWAVVGGTFGGWLASRRRYEEPAPPRPTSA